MNRELVDIGTDAIRTNRELRQDQGDLTTLENSIRKLGLLNPIVVSKDNVLVAGGRRLLACRSIGMTTIPAWRTDIEGNSLTALTVQSDENLCRLPLSGEELDNLINAKRDLLEDKRSGRRPGFLARLKKLFSPNK